MGYYADRKGKEHSTFADAQAANALYDGATAAQESVELLRKNAERQVADQKKRREFEQDSLRLTNERNRSLERAEESMLEATNARIRNEESHQSFMRDLECLRSCATANDRLAYIVSQHRDEMATILIRLFKKIYEESQPGRELAVAVRELSAAETEFRKAEKAAVELRGRSMNVFLYLALFGGPFLLCSAIAAANANLLAANFAILVGIILGLTMSFLGSRIWRKRMLRVAESCAPDLCAKQNKVNSLREQRDEFEENLQQLSELHIEAINNPEQWLTLMPYATWDALVSRLLHKFPPHLQIKSAELGDDNLWRLTEGIRVKVTAHFARKVPPRLNGMPPISTGTS